MKKIIQKIDNKLLNSTIYKLYKKFQLLELIFKVSRKDQYNILLNYEKDSSSVFSSLCDTYGSDKGSISDLGNVYSWKAHTYADLYSLLFQHNRYGVKKVFECGIGTNQSHLASSMGVQGRPGASLRVWRDYFPNAEILGVDIDRTILFTEERIKTAYVDQTDSNSVSELWSSIDQSDFDLMIDDGLHTFSSSITLFENSVTNLNASGIYVIEDVSLSDLARYKEYFSEKNYKVTYVNLFRPMLSLDNNNVVLIQHKLVV